MNMTGTDDVGGTSRRVTLIYIAVLRLIYISHCRVTDKVAIRLLQKCRPYLVHLNIRGCQQISFPTFQCIRECRNLQDLNLSECPALSVTRLLLLLFVLRAIAKNI